MSIFEASKLYNEMNIVSIELAGGVLFLWLCLITAVIIVIHRTPDAKSVRSNTIILVVLAIISVGVSPFSKPLITDTLVAKAYGQENPSKKWKNLKKEYMLDCYNKTNEKVVRLEREEVVGKEIKYYGILKNSKRVKITDGVKQINTLSDKELESNTYNLKVYKVSKSVSNKFTKDALKSGWYININKGLNK